MAATKTNGGPRGLAAPDSDELPVMPKGADLERMPALIPSAIDKIAEVTISLLKEVRGLAIEQRHATERNEFDADRTFVLATKSAALVEAMALRVERLDNEREKPINATIALRSDFERLTKHMQLNEERAATRRENINSDLSTKYDRIEGKLDAQDGRQDAIERSLSAISTTLVERKDSALASIQLELLRTQAKTKELETTLASTEKIETKKVNYGLIGVVVGGIVTVVAALVGGYEIVHHEAKSDPTHQDGVSK